MARRKNLGKAKTINNKRYRKRDLEFGRILNPPIEDLEEIKKNWDCSEGIRPCPFISCRKHMFCEQHSKGSITFNYPEFGEDLSKLPYTCCIDLIMEKGNMTLEEVGEYFKVTRERIRQVEDEVFNVLRLRDDMKQSHEEVEEQLVSSDRVQWFGGL